MASEAQIAANRRNASLSTGPTSEAGKRRSRANSLKHGLCAVVVAAEDPERLQTRAWHVYMELQPKNSYQAWLCDQVALGMVRADRCHQRERQARDKAAFRALTAWDDDRVLAVEALGKRIEASPAEVVAIFRKTPQGCDWLLGRWAQLAYAAKNGEWTEEQVRLAFDLLATPREFRAGRKPGVVLDLYGEVVEGADDPVAVARRQVDELVRHRESTLDVDEIERSLAESDLAEAKDPEVRRHRRYEAEIHRRIRWCVAQVKDPKTREERPCYLVPGYTQPAQFPSEARPEPELKPEPPMVEEVLLQEWQPQEPFTHPPFDLEPEEYAEPGQLPDIPQIVRSRKQKQLAKAEARREARRRKLDQFRA